MCTVLEEFDCFCDGENRHKTQNHKKHKRKFGMIDTTRQIHGDGRAERRVSVTKRQEQGSAVFRRGKRGFAQS